MKRMLIRAAILILAAAAWGCGGGKSTDTKGAAGGAAVSPYDNGPRAADSPVAVALAEKGAGLFKAKGCTACHAYGKRLTGPDLKGVTHRRTADWMEHQILHPEIMTKEDPISRQLLATYAVQMSNQGLTPDEAKSVIEYLKKLDEETDEKEGTQAQK
ncbi:MAG TPA: cytochrome c [Candidatus Eisenbacteria bacterium]